MHTHLSVEPGSPGFSSDCPQLYPEGPQVSEHRSPPPEHTHSSNSARVGKRSLLLTSYYHSRPEQTSITDENKEIYIRTKYIDRQTNKKSFYLTIEHI